MRLANGHQHPLHLQVTRTNNGKFLVSPNGQQDNINNGDRRLQHRQSPNCDEASAVVSRNVGFPSFETASSPPQGPTILGDRFLLVGPAEGSALYRCVDVTTGQQLVAKVCSLFLIFSSQHTQSYDVEVGIPQIHRNSVFS